MDSSVGGAEQQRVLGNFKSPAAVKEVLSGIRTVANASWWGFDETDSTAAVQGAISSGAAKVIIPYMGKEWVVRPIKLTSDREVIFEPGVVVVAKQGGFKGTHDSLFKADKKSNIILKGYGATLRMRKAEYMAIPKKSRGEWRHVIGLLKSSNVTILGLTLKDSGGDGIAVDRHCKDILIKDVTCDGNYRNAISVTNVDGLTIENCVLTNTTGSEKGGGGPAAGIDFEPFRDFQSLKKIIVRKCVVEGNGMFGIVVSLGRLRTSSNDVDILIEDCLVNNNSRTGLYVSHVHDDGPGGSIKFKNVTVRGSQWGARIRSKSSKRASVVFENCTWRDIKKAKGAYPVNFYLPTAEAGKIEKLGGVTFINCQVFDDQDRPAVKYTGAIKDLHAIHGDVYVKNDKRNRDLHEWGGARLHDVDIVLHSGLSEMFKKADDRSK